MTDSFTHSDDFRSENPRLSDEVPYYDPQDPPEPPRIMPHERHQMNGAYERQGENPFARRGGQAPGGHVPGGHAPGGHVPGGHVPGGQMQGAPPSENPFQQGWNQPRTEAPPGHFSRPDSTGTSQRNARENPFYGQQQYQEDNPFSSKHAAVHPGTHSVVNQSIYSGMNPAMNFGANQAVYPGMQGVNSAMYSGFQGFGQNGPVQALRVRSYFD